MKKLIVIAFLLLNSSVWAHHTKEHTMLMENPEQVIAETQQGVNGSGFSVLWLGVAILFAAGVLRLINKK